MSKQLGVIGRSVAAVLLLWSAAASLPASAATYYVATGEGTHQRPAIAVSFEWCKQAIESAPFV